MVFNPFSDADKSLSGPLLIFLGSGLVITGVIFLEDFSGSGISDRAGLDLSIGIVRGLGLILGVGFAGFAGGFIFFPKFSSAPFLVILVTGLGVCFGILVLGLDGDLERLTLLP